MNVCQIHDIEPGDKVAFRQQLNCGRVLAFFKEPEPCLVGIEVCATSLHWAREIGALGRDIKLSPPRRSM